MASWKKVIVSGSQAELAGITGSLLTDDRLLGARDGGAVYSTGIEINSEGHLVGTLSGSASGSFEGDGSGLTGVVAQIENNLVDGNGIADFSFDGSSEVSVAVEALSARNGQIQPVSVAAGGVGFDVDLLDGTGLTATDGVLNVTGLTVSEFDADAIVDSSEAISNATTGSDTTFATTKAIKDYVDTQLGASDLDIVGDTGTDAIDLDSETLTFAGGNGISTTVTSGQVSIDGVAGLVSGSGQVVEHLPAGTVSGSIQVDGASITNNSIGFAADSGTTQEIDLGADIDIAGGSNITTTVSAGQVEVALDAQIDNIGATGSFTGSFTGDGSGLTGLASTLNIGVKENAADASTEAVTIDLLDDTLVIQGVANEISASSAGDVITIGLPDDVTIGNDLTVTGDLVVNGDMTTLNTVNLNIEDQFILLNSGSDGTDVDTGIIFGGTEGVEQNGKAVYYDGGDDKFGFSTAINSDATTGTLSQYIGAIELDTADPVNGTVGVQGAGTIHVNTATEDIFIYV